MTTLTPPPETPTTPPAPQGHRRTAPRVITILIIALGVALLIGAVVAGIVRSVAASATEDDSRTLDVTGVTELTLDAAAGDLTVTFADVDEASLEIVDGRAGWTFERDGDELRVASPDGWFWFDVFGPNSNGRVTLTLPEELEGMDASLDLAAGSLTAEGTFTELSIDMAAGDLTVVGDARTLSADVGAGRADLRLAGVREAAFDLAAGSVNAELTGTVPREVRIDVSAGSLDLQLPPGDYDVTSDVSAGNLDNRLQSGTGRSGSIDVQLSAGDVTLTTGR